ncbi:MAG: HDOD domain-containing protein [Phycisphaerales bacterium]
MKARKELSAREIDALQESLLRRLGDSSVPTLPHVAVRVLELVSDTNSSFRDFAKAIETDQALTGRLLRMANSHSSAKRNPVTRIERAAMLLGMDRLKALALGFHLSKAATTATDASVKRAWTHALFRACLAARVAENFDSRVSGEAFVVALMADAGRPLMPGLIGDRYPQFIDDNTLPQDQFRAEFESLPFTHVDVAAAMCKLWNLPEVLRRPIIAHHTRPTTFTRSDTPGLLHAVAYFVGSIPTQPPDHKSIASETATQARALFNFKPTEVAAIVEQAAHDLDAYKEFFQHILDETVSSTPSSTPQTPTSPIRPMISPTSPRPTKRRPSASSAPPRSSSKPHASMTQQSGSTSMTPAASASPQRSSIPGHDRTTNSPRRSCSTTSIPPKPPGSSPQSGNSPPDPAPARLS